MPLQNLCTIHGEDLFINLGMDKQQQSMSNVEASPICFQWQIKINDSTLQLLTAYTRDTDQIALMVTNIDLLQERRQWRGGFTNFTFF